MTVIRIAFLGAVVENHLRAADYCVKEGRDFEVQTRGRLIPTIVLLHHSLTTT